MINCQVLKKYQLKLEYKNCSESTRFYLFFISVSFDKIFLRNRCLEV